MKTRKLWKRGLSLMLALALLITLAPAALAAETETPKTAKEAVAEMTWGVNLVDLYIADIQPEEGYTTGYVDFQPIAELGIGVWFWDDSYEWLTYHDGYRGTFTVSTTVPTYSSSTEYSLIRLGFFAREPGQRFDVTLSNSKIIKSDNTEVAIPSLDITYQGNAATEPNSNGWYTYALWDLSGQPEESADYNGATFRTTVTINEGSYTTTSKADYYYELGRENIDEKQLIDEYIAQGVNVFRLPVTWTWFVDDQTFVIDGEWMAKIKGTVDYILGQGAYCILDMHNDYMNRSFVATKNESTGLWENFKWTGDWMYPQYKEYVDARFAEVWRQIAEYFKDCSDKLIFETCNEPAMTWTDSHESDYTTWIGYMYNRPNELNQLFVETVRGTGGNNQTRLLCLAVAQWNQHQNLSVQTESINGQALNTYGLTIPANDGYLIAQIHSYAELEDPGYIEGFNWKTETDTLFSDVAKFQEEHPNVPVIVGEVGISHAAENTGNEENKTAAAGKVAYFCQKATENGVPCLWWEDYFPVTDEGRNHTYWIYDKAAREWGRPEILAAIQENTRKVSRILSLKAAEGTMTASVSAGQAASIYCAFYDASGRMLGASCQTMTAGIQKQSFPIPSGAARCKVFLLSQEGSAPLCEAKETTLVAG